MPQSPQQKEREPTSRHVGFRYARQYWQRATAAISSTPEVELLEGYGSSGGWYGLMQPDNGRLILSKAETLAGSTGMTNRSNVMMWLRNNYCAAF